ncbi:hypothetical protein [Actinoplanes sp. NPDC049118]|uniref:hypothetical protein n=1 Tax=Actinoplanes sp. NPDC049118 TaxID=3155769 RepID=UPI0033C554B4
MIQSGDSGRRRSYLTLAGWYGAALVIPTAVFAVGDSSSAGYEGRESSCTAANNCLTAVPDAAQVLRITMVFLAVSLVVALPLRAYLMRAWRLPALAGTVAALTSWWVTVLLYCAGLALLSR